MVVTDISTTYETSCCLGEIPNGWRKADIVPRARRKIWSASPQCEENHSAGSPGGHIHKHVRDAEVVKKQLSLICEWQLFWAEISDCVGSGHALLLTSARPLLLLCILL